MRYRIAIRESDEGFSVCVPGLPGCWSQGATEAEAIDNIKDAMRAYLDVVDEQLRRNGARGDRRARLRHTQPAVLDRPGPRR